MATAVRLSDDLVALAKKHAGLAMRSVPKQIEYWCKLARLIEENPQLSLNAIKSNIESARGDKMLQNTTKGHGLLRKSLSVEKKQ
jgi:hypothetical protein